MAGDDVMYTLSFIILLLITVLFLILAFIAYRRYLATEDPGKVKAVFVAVVAGLVILSINLVGVLPVVGYDSVRYMVTLGGNETTTVILPFPDEAGLLSEIEVKRGRADIQLVESEKGRGLQVVFGGYVYLEGYHMVRYAEVDYSAELDDGDAYLVFLNTTYDPGWFRIDEFRIIHQSPSDFHSKQIFTHRGELEQGWNRIEWDIYRE